MLCRWWMAWRRPQPRIDPDEPVLWLDVRSAAEYAGGHWPGALHIPHNEVAARIGSVCPDKQRLIMVYCHSGGRSALARRTLRRLGYARVINRGGWARLQAQASRCNNEQSGGLL